YYRAYATNSIGTGYGDELYFATTLEGLGTGADPYEISNLNDLRILSENSVYWDSYFIQIADIDATDTQNWNNGAGFSPIGEDTFNPFNGDYDGAGFTIDGLFINRSNTNSIGLFGHTFGASFFNLGVTNVDVTGSWFVGSLVGYNETSTVTNSYSTGSLSGNEYVGGLVGSNYYSSPNNNYSTCSVNGDASIGGLVGFITESSVINSYSAGNVSGVERVGGLVGYSKNNSTITNCYSTGSVNGDASIGGLLGYNHSSSVNNCFWDIQTSGQYSSDGGTGKTTAEMQTESTFIDAGWDFTSIWSMDYFYGMGYPFFNWQDVAPAGSVPLSPENFQVVINTPDVYLSWDVVIESTEGYAIIPDGYIIYYSEDEENYYFLTITNQTSFIHYAVTDFSSQMFYQVVAIKVDDSRQLSYLQGLNNRKEKIRWNEVEE
ncbi:MAG: hypothetical protein K8S23_11935, partial [Candidatus Cloacimonetes bacterium]|nr:hypothetical protein [Candidatus Cloacimonadota bacterium]